MTHAAAIPLGPGAGLSLGAFRTDYGDVDLAAAARLEVYLAFLHGDKPGLMAARERLMAVPQPANWEHIQQLYKEQAGWVPAWPENIEAVDKMISCWGKGYTGGSQGDCEWRPHTKAVAP